MSSTFDNYLSTWLHSISSVLEQLGGEKFVAELSGADAAGLFSSLDGRGVWLRFVLGKRLQGQQAFLISEADGARLARMLMGEPSGPSADDTLTDDYRDALEEVFRQFAGSTAAALKNAQGEAGITWEGVGRPAWPVFHQVLVRISAAGGPPVMVGVAMDEALRNSLSPETQPAFGVTAPSGNSAAAASAAAGAGSSGDPSARTNAVGAPSLSGPAGRNLDLLMDVPLQVTLRFGERQLLLRDVLELSPGSVVELDRQVKEPAELLVTGRVVARGEVVIVDGNYGLRITEVAPPSTRAEVLL
jgi:flagellar motor switch protein FliN